jgi:hypothetical protein
MIAQDRRDELVAYSNLVAGGLVTDVGHDALMLAYALAYAAAGWAVLPLRGKVPAIPKAVGGAGVLDATTDIATICGWWAVDYVGANIGARVPAGVVVLDSDPRKEGHAAALAKLTAEHGPMPRTLTHLSGRLDGGVHRFYRRPAGKLSSKPLGPGFDLKESSGYVVLPPSVHPDTSQPYLALDAPIVGCGWLADLLVVPETVAPQRATNPHGATQARFWRSNGGTGQSIADAFTDSTSWADVLEPHGWRCLDRDPNEDGARWLHPSATSATSATITNGMLFCYSTSTELAATTAGDPHGYTRFRAYAVLNFGGDLSAAARSLRKMAVA